MFGKMFLKILAILREAKKSNFVSVCLRDLEGKSCSAGTGLLMAAVRRRFPKSGVELRGTDGSFSFATSFEMENICLALS